MPGNDLWTPMRVKNFMRELELVPTKWEENIVALAEQGRMTVEEFLATDPITFGEKIWGKCKNVYDKNKVWDILGERTYYEMLGPYYRAPAQVAAKAFMDAKVAAIKEQKALGLTSYMSVSAEDKAGWERVFAENKAMESLEAAEEATREAEVAKAAVLAELDQEKAAEQQSKLAKEAVEAVTAGWARQAAEDLAFAERQVAALRKIMNPEEEIETTWTCDACSAVWRTKTKTE